MVRILDMIMRSSLLKNMACRFMDNLPHTSFQPLPTYEASPAPTDEEMYSKTTQQTCPRWDWSHASQLLFFTVVTLHNAALTIRDCLVFVGCAQDFVKFAISGTKTVFGISTHSVRFRG